MVMKTDKNKNQPRFNFPLFLIIGAVAVLTPIFYFLTVQSLDRQRQNVTRLLVEKGAAVVRSLEAGARTGMRGMMGMMGKSGFRLQFLLVETARQPDISYIMVTDQEGMVQAHNHKEKIGSSYGHELDFNQIAASKVIEWREVDTSDGERIFEVFTLFQPAKIRRHHQFNHYLSKKEYHQDPAALDTDKSSGPAQIIFVGFNMEAVHKAQQEDARHIIFMAAILLLVCFAGLLTVFLLQAYRSSQSEIKELKQEVLRSQRLAAIGRLAAGVAHEIRNPLSSIKGFATYFKERYKDDKEDQEIAGIMIQEVERLNRVIGQLLEFSRPLVVQPKPVSVGELFDKSLMMIEEDARRKGIKVIKSVPPPSEQIIIDGDRLKQVLLNLYLNAIEAMAEGGELRVAARVEDEMLQIQVADNGRGIDPDEIGAIFDPYYTTKSSGTGLGLAIVHKIIEACDGQISVQSEVGSGTEFSLRIPVNHQGDG